jgi:hypothetical protein
MLENMFHYILPYLNMFEHVWIYLNMFEYIWTYLNMLGHAWMRLGLFQSMSHNLSARLRISCFDIFEYF